MTKKNDGNGRKVVFTFGRFTPPTIGHAKLINKVVDVAKQLGAENRIYTSKSFDHAKNPIPYKDKVSFLKQLFPQANIEDDPNAHTAFHVAKILSDEGYRDVTMVVGSDRVEEFRTSIGKYIKDRNDPKFDPKKHYSFDKFNVVSAGERDPDAAGVEGMSGTKMREAAIKGDLKAFASGIPTNNVKLVKKIFDVVRKNLSISEALEHEEGDEKEIDHKKFGPMLDSFTKFASEKLGLKSMPKMELSKDELETSFGGYNPATKSIVVVSKNRHPMDIFRTVAHELVHHKQNEEGRIGKDISQEGSTGSDIENEANSEAGKIMRWFAKANPETFKSGYVIESVDLTEGLNDPAKMKAIFLAGGPGSGKDWVMHRTMLGHGLTEINSDNALEYLMQKRGLDMMMPKSETKERNKARGEAKNMTKERQRLALAGRRGVIINGTGDDADKIAAIKAELEKNGYESKMVFVNTNDEVSKQRNLERGKMGKRKVPDGTDAEGRPDGSEDIRGQKWQAAQEAKERLRKLFGDEHFIHVDNSDDYRSVDDKRRKEIDDEHGAIYKHIRKFVSAPVETANGQEWIENEKRKRDVQDYKEAQATKMSQKKSKPQPVQPEPYQPDASELEQAKRLGVQHLGNGEFGVANKKESQVTHVSNNGQLVMAEEKKTKIKACWKGYEAIGFKKKNGKRVPNCVPVSEEGGAGEWGTDKLRKRYEKDTPGSKKKMKMVKKKMIVDANQETLGYEFGNNGIGPTFGVVRSPSGLGFGYSLPMSESVQAWMNDEKTITRFTERYGDLAEQKILETAETLTKMNFNKTAPKHLGSLREAWEAMGGRDMGTVPNQGKEEIKEKKLTDAELDMREKQVKKLKKYKKKFTNRYGKDGESVMYAVATKQAKEMAEEKDVVKPSKSIKGYKKLVHPMSDFEQKANSTMEEDWQDVNRKDKTDGLSQKAVDAYRRENPGSKLQTAVTEKKPKGKRAKRRLSFCRRMKGMKKRLTSAETARDPDSRINKALRRWNCEE